MQQRQPRLGDIVDDYCPRERRITNHAVVAMVGDAVKQTRCTTCDADHEYKQAKVPAQRRKKEEGGVLYQQVLAGMPRKAPGIPVAGGPDDASDLPPDPPVSDEPQSEPDAEPVEAVEASTGIPDESVHRPLIRATLPRLTDEPPQRREPEFTMRTPQHTRPGKFGRGGFRGGRPGAGGGQGFGGNGGANGHRSDGQRHGQGPGPRPGNSQGSGRPGQSQGNRHGRPGGGPGQGHGHGNGPGRGGKKSPR
jgi:hypothetical protein